MNSLHQKDDLHSCMNRTVYQKQSHIQQKLTPLTEGNITLLQ